MAAVYSLVICALLVAVVQVSGNPGDTGTGVTTRYWDCCKPSCSWKSNVSNMLKGPVTTCDVSGKPIANVDAKSGCEDGGVAYTCKKQQPRAISKTTAYGFVAARVDGKSLQDICCSCYKLTFPKEAKLAGKQMIVQITNTGADLEAGHFDIQMPGGGVGIFNGCHKQWNAPQPNGWGERYGGIHTKNDCAGLPKDLQPGCNFRFDWFANADNPAMAYTRVACPAEIIAESGCQRADDSHYPHVNAGEHSPAKHAKPAQAKHTPKKH